MAVDDRVLFRVQGSASEFRVQGSGVRGQGLGVRVQCSGWRTLRRRKNQSCPVQPFGLQLSGLGRGVWIWGLGLEVGGLGFGVWVWGLGFRVWG